MNYTGFILNYFLSNSTSISEKKPDIDTYIKIATDIFYLSVGANFESFEFKKNKRGGESGKIKFPKVFGRYTINDTVEFILKGEKVFKGVIEKITDYGLTLEIIPLWGLLDYVFITNTLELEESSKVYDLVLSLKDKIESIGIKFNKENILIPKDDNTLITTTLAGRSIRDILDELEKELPNNYVYGVDSNGEFYFKSFSEEATLKLSWHRNNFSDTEYEEDYSELYSQYVVKIKDNSMNAFNVLKPILGEDAKYPKTYITDLVGKKTRIFEYNFEANETEALEYAYNHLKAQVAIQKLKVKNINYKNISLEQNKAYKVILKSQNSFFEDFNIDFSTSITVGTDRNSGEIIKIGYPIGYARRTRYTNGVLYLSKQINYLSLCNRALDIYEIIVYYISNNKTNLFSITDGVNTINKFGKNGILKCDIKGFDKRNLIIKNEKNDALNYSGIIFKKVRAFFTQGSREIDLNIRSMDYKYSKGILKLDINMAKLNSVLTGYFYEKEKKLEKLETLLTNSKN